MIPIVLFFKLFPINKYLSLFLFKTELWACGIFLIKENIKAKVNSAVEEILFKKLV